MMKQLSVFVTGLLFSFGLIISGMINPNKVLGFLDIFGKWDPSLGFVMGGAVLVTYFGYRFVFKRTSPIFESKFSVPTRSDIDTNLVAGAIMFGVGWGLVGVCPGPAIAGFAVAPKQIFVFLIAMLVGMYLSRLLNLRTTFK